MQTAEAGASAPAGLEDSRTAPVPPPATLTQAIQQNELEKDRALLPPVGKSTNENGHNRLKAFAVLGVGAVLMLIARSQRRERREPLTAGTWPRA